MRSDGAVLSVIDAAFGPVARPEHFHLDLSDDEAAEHDRLLRSRDRDTLKLSDVNNGGWDPICDAMPCGIAYYFPKLARFALATPLTPYDWYAQQLLFHLSYEGDQNKFYLHCNTQQRTAVADLIAHTLETRVELMRELESFEEFTECLMLWRSPSQ